MKKYYLTAQELAPILQISVANAYVRIREMNEELKVQGYHVLQGKVPIAYVKQKFYGVDFEEVANDKN